MLNILRRDAEVQQPLLSFTPYGLAFGVFQLETVKCHHDLSLQLLGHLKP